MAILGRQAWLMPCLPLVAQAAGAKLHKQALLELSAGISCLAEQMLHLLTSTLSLTVVSAQLTQVLNCRAMGL